MDIGVSMSREVLADKLSLRESRNPEAAWNLRTWPEGFVQGARNRLFVACGGAWIGYFRIGSHAIVNYQDRATPFTMLFDTRTWTRIEPVPAPRFRGFTYNVPSVDGSGVRRSRQSTAATTAVGTASDKPRVVSSDQEGDTDRA